MADSFMAQGITESTNLLAGITISLDIHFDTSYDDHNPDIDSPAAAASAHFEELKASVNIWDYNYVIVFHKEDTFSVILLNSHA